MDIFPNIEKGVRVWSFDSGGNGILSQLIIVDKVMRHIQWEKRLNEVPRPCDHADVMIGTGLGGATAILMGRLRLTASQTYDEIVHLGRTVFLKPNTSSEKPLFSLDILKTTIASILERHGYKSNTMMIGDEPSSKKCHIIVLASFKVNATGYKSLRTYTSPKNINCTVVDAIAATMAVPDWFDSVTVGDGHESQVLVGGPVGYNNPTWEGLLEAKEIFGVDACITSLISIGSGKSPSAVTATSMDQSSIFDDHTRYIKQIHADCEQTARRLSGYFRDVLAYSRFSVDDVDDMDIFNWAEGATDLVNSRTASYLENLEVRKDLDNAVANLLLDVGSITLGKITQVTVVPTGARSVPRLTPYYVPRPEIHGMMDKHLNIDEEGTQKLLVIQGMAGSGKTQSASYFARSHRKRYHHVFFIDASSVASIKADLQSAIRSLGGSHSQGTFEDAVRYLHNTESQHWLVIFDNADDPGLPLTEFIPSCDRGHVIITTRNPDLALLAPTSHFSVEPMEEDKALSVLFLAAQSPKLGSKTDDQSALKICKLVGSLPLALVQVGCYCYSSKVSFAQYLERYNEHRGKLMNMRPGWQLDQYPHSAYTSISLSYSLLDEKEKDLFYLLSFFHPSSIHTDIFRASAAHQFTVDPDNLLVPRDDFHDERLQKLRAIFEENGKWDQHHVDQLLMRLQTLSLVSLGSDDGTPIISIHPLVQSFAQDIMAPEEVDCFLYMAIITLSGCVWDENVFLFRHLILHISEAESRKVSLHPDDTTSFAYIFYAMYLYREAIQRWNALRHRCKDQLGPEHPSILFTTVWIASCLSLLCEYEACANEINSAILVHKRLLGRDHRDICRAYQALAISLNCQGKLQEAEVICRENIEILQKKYGNKHDYTLQHAASFSTTLFKQAKYSEAENLLRETITSMRQVYEKDDNNLLKAIRRFSQILIKCDKWEEAEDVLRSLVHSYAKVFGKGDSRLALPLSNLALCVRRKGELREAERLQRMALELMEKDKGVNHPVVEIRKSLEETVRMIDQENGGANHNINGNELSRAVDYKRHKVLLTILTVLVVFVATFIPVTQILSP